MQEEITLAVRVGRIEREVELLKSDLENGLKKFKTEENVNRGILICDDLSEKIKEVKKDLFQKVNRSDHKVDDLKSDAIKNRDMIISAIQDLGKKRKSNGNQNE